MMMRRTWAGAAVVAHLGTVPPRVMFADGTGSMTCGGGRWGGAGGFRGGPARQTLMRVAHRSCLTVGARCVRP